jgi:hypothetical protein
MSLQLTQRFKGGRPAGDQKKKEIAKNHMVKKNPRKETFIVHRG